MPSKVQIYAQLFSHPLCDQVAEIRFPVSARLCIGARKTCQDTSVLGVCLLFVPAYELFKRFITRAAVFGDRDSFPCIRIDPVM